MASAPLSGGIWHTKSPTLMVPMQAPVSLEPAATQSSWGQVLHPYRLTALPGDPALGQM
jgi:hypothetical protein